MFPRSAIFQDFKRAVDVLIDDLRQGRRMPNVDRIWLAGRAKRRARPPAKNTRDRIPIAAALLRTLDRLADDLRIDRLVK